MNCPQCNIALEQALIAHVEVDYCPRCYGLWFERNELRWAKDDRDQELQWLDVDLWKDPANMHVSPGKKMCPKDRLPLYEVRYGDSETQVDVCNLCHGIWLDRGEFKDIMAYLHGRAEYEVLHRYTKDLLEELWEIYAGPEILREEVSDFLSIVKLLKYKFPAEHDVLARTLVSLPR